MVADRPAHVVARIREDRRPLPSHLPPTVGLPAGGYQRRRAVGEDRIGNDEITALTILEVEAAELDGNDHNHAPRIGREGTGHPQAVESAVASHEADVRPGDGRGEPNVGDDLEVDAGIGKAGAGAGDQVRHPPRIDAGEG